MAKRWMLSVLLLIVGFGACVMPAHAMPWSEYGNTGPVATKEPGGFFTPKGAATDTDGNLYVADADRILKLTASTGEWSALGNGGGLAPGQFSGVSGVAVDGAGNLYVADTSNHRVQKWNASTGEWSVWGKPGGESGSGLGEFSYPVDVAVDSAGNVYVAENGNHRLQKYSPADGSWQIFSAFGANPGSFYGPSGLSIDSENNVYVADSLHHWVQKLDVSTGEWSVWGKPGGESGTGLGEFNHPAAVAVDADGNVYVAERDNKRIQKLTASTGEWSEWGIKGEHPGISANSFNAPEGIATDGDGNVFVVDTKNYRVLKYTLSTEEWSQWAIMGPAAGTSPGHFYNPSGIAIDASGNLYVADTTNHRVQKLSAATGEWTEWGKGGGESGAGPGEFSQPVAVAVDGNGNLYVSDRGNGRIQVLDGQTGLWSTWGSVGAGPGQFKNPGGIAVDGNGNVYVADANNHRIQVRSSAGTWTALGSAGTDLGQLFLPAGVAVDGAGNVYVADTNNHRVQKLTAAGEWSEWKKAGGGSGSAPGEFFYPSGIAVDAAGNVYVADTRNSRIQKLTVSTGEWSVLGASGMKPGEFSNPGGVAVDAGGNVYVADTSNHRIQILSMPGAPTALAATAGDGQVEIAFAPPSNAADSEVIGYTVTANPGGITAGGTSSPIRVTGLTNGVTYSFTVTAESVYGSSVPSAELTATPQVPAPGAPVLEAPEAGNAQVTLKWQPVEGSGSYKVFQSESGSSEGNEVEDAAYEYSVSDAVYRSIVTGLTNGTTYYFVVKAVNAGGESPASNQVSAVPYAVPPPADDDDEDDDSGAGGGQASPSGQNHSAVPVAPDSGADILVNGKAESAGIVTTAEQDGRRVTTVAVDEDKLKALLAAEGQHAEVTIPVNGDADVIAGELTGRMVKGMENQEAVLEIRTGSATYKLPAQQIHIDAVSAQLGAVVALEDIKVRIEISAPTAAMLSAAERAAADASMVVVAPPLQFTVTAIYGDRTVEVGKFSEYVERMIAIPEGADRTRITTGVVIDPDGTVRHVPTQVVNVDGTYYARINSLTNSTYAVVWHPVAFRDMVNHWAEDVVNDMGSRMVVSGDGNGTFGPDRIITRAEFAAVMVRALGLGPEWGDDSFSDVAGSDWFAGAVRTAGAYGLVHGFEDGTFRPNEVVTREQAMVMMARAMAVTNLKGKLGTSKPEEILSPFRDAADVSDWALAGIADSVAAGIAQGRNGAVLSPKALLTRAEAAAMAARLLSKSGLI